MKLVYARADKVPDKGGSFFTEGNEYMAHIVDATRFYVFADNGAPFYQMWEPSGESSIHWTRIEYPYRNPQAVEEMIADVRLALDAPMYDLSGKGQGVFGVLRKALARLEGGEAALGVNDG